MKDPVCSMEVEEPPRIAAAWKGHDFGFCSDRCLHQFQSHPEAYLGAPAPKNETLKSLRPLFVMFFLVLLFSAGPELYYGQGSLPRFMANFMAAFFLFFVS